jgi:hypothetical protein
MVDHADLSSRYDLVSSQIQIYRDRFDKFFYEF